MRNATDIRGLLRNTAQSLLTLIPDAVDFYENTLQFLIENNRQGFSVRQCAEVFAILSANTSIETNKRLYLLFQETGMLCGQNANRLYRYLNGEEVFRSLSKTSCFVENLLLNDAVITVDRWILRLHAVNPDTFNWTRDYEPVHNALYPVYAEVAETLGMQPFQLQALLWEGIRLGIIPPALFPIPK